MEINLETYNYLLPEDRIAKFPKENRSASKLLVYQNEEIQHDTFSNIIKYIPQNSLLVFNDTKVIQARLDFYKSSGAKIEIFCLSPLSDPALTNSFKIRWKCLVGNKKKWKEGRLLIEVENVSLSAEIIENQGNEFIVEFYWKSEHNFYEILEICGKTPLPPYLKREAVVNDKTTYQTVYAQHNGAVAAPTAGLHFTKEILDKLPGFGIDKAFTTLHVSAGTFQPIKENNIIEHQMHNEKTSFTIENLIKIYNHQGPIISVGTTSLRSLESLYWFGVQLANNDHQEFSIPKLYPYQKFNSLPTAKESLKYIIDYMEKEDLKVLWGDTSIFIFPSYNFKIVKGLITNFHQPKSTLLLLVSALIGPAWENVYKSALENDYRFLSYGDSSILFPNS